MPEVRVLPSTGITWLHRYYGPVRLPPPLAEAGAPPKVGVEAATLAATGLPRCIGSPSRRAVPTTPADRTGAPVDCFPIRAAFPDARAGRHPRLHFRGLLRLHSRYGPSSCSTAQGGLCHEASTRPVTRPSRSSATRPIDNYLGGSYLHWLSVPYRGTRRVEERRGGLSLWQSLRFLSPLIEPDLPICGLRLSDWFHRKSHGIGSHAS